MRPVSGFPKQGRLPVHSVQPPDTFTLLRPQEIMPVSDVSDILYPDVSQTATPVTVIEVSFH